MASKSRTNKVWMIPEGEDRKHVSYHFVVKKSVTAYREGKKLRYKKYHPGKREHVWFVESRMPPHSK